MKIGIDARLLSTPIRGIASYLANLIKFIPKYDNVNEYFLFQYENLPKENNFYKFISIQKNNLPRQVFEHYWINFTLPKLIREYSIDIFFTPYIFVPLFKGKWKNVIVVADSLTKMCRQYYTFHYRKYIDILVPPSIKRSDSIITISESAKNDIIKSYHINKDSIEVLYLWADDKYKPLNFTKDEKNALLKRFNLPEKYVLFVSVVEERKNINGIIKVSDILQSRGVDLKFVLIGRPGFGFSKIAPELEKRVNRIIHLNGISNEDLVALYNLATIFFFPTHYEGFGLPPLEAMSCGLPVIASDNSSLPEVIGDAGLMSDSNNFELFADHIIQLLSDQNLYNAMKVKSLDQAKNFTSKIHITKLVQIFNSMK